MPSGRYRILPPIFSVHRASVSFWAALFGSFGQISLVVLPALIAPSPPPCSAASALAPGRHRRSGPTSRDVALLLQLPVERLHHPLQCAGLGQPVPEQLDRVLVRRRPAEIKAQEAHPGQPVPDHELHPCVAQIMLGLQDQGLEHRHRIEGRTSSLGSVAVAQPLNQPSHGNARNRPSPPEPPAGPRSCSDAQDAPKARIVTTPPSTRLPFMTGQIESRTHKSREVNAGAQLSRKPVGRDDQHDTPLCPPWFHELAACRWIARDRCLILGLPRISVCRAWVGGATTFCRPRNTDRNNRNHTTMKEVSLSVRSGGQIHNGLKWFRRLHAPCRDRCL